MNWLPRLSFGAWGGGDLDGVGAMKGYSLAFQWGPIFLELCIARRGA